MILFSPISICCKYPLFHNLCYHHGRRYQRSHLHIIRRNGVSKNIQEVCHLSTDLFSALHLYVLKRILVQISQHFVQHIQQFCADLPATNQVVSSQQEAGSQSHALSFTSSYLLSSSKVTNLQFSLNGLSLRLLTMILTSSLPMIVLTGGYCCCCCDCCYYYYNYCCKLPYAPQLIFLLFRWTTRSSF